MTDSKISTGLMLKVERLLQQPVFIVKQLVGNNWITINCADDIGRAATVLVALGYQADFKAALKTLNDLSLV
jgi:hypothetical protein